MALSTYASEGNAFGLKDPRFYGPNGHRGQDYHAATGDPILAYRPGTVRMIQRSRYIGLCVVMEDESGGVFLGWAHTKDVRVSVGQHVGVGAVLAYVAGPNDDPGSTWDGAHVHTTRGPSVQSIFEGTVWDPRPAINAAKGSSLSSLGTTPVENTLKGPNDMFLRREVGGTIYLYTGNGRVRIGQPSHVDLFSRMFKTYPSYDDMLQAELDILYSYIVAANTSDDGETAKILDAISKVQPLDPKAVADALRPALVDSVAKSIAASGVKVDSAAIAAGVDAALADNFAALPKAVADEAARRMTS